MGVVENIRENIKDIVGGGPATRYERGKREAEAEFERKRVPTEEGLREKTTTGESVPGTVRTITGGGGARGGTTDISRQQTPAQREAERQKAIAEKKLIEEMRKAGIEEAARRTEQALRGQKLVESLGARQEITQLARERGKGFTRKQIEAELRKRGTSLKEFRQASRAAREQFKKTGASVTEQIRLKAEVPEVVTVEEIPSRVIDFNALSAGKGGIITGEVQPAPEPEGLIERAQLFFTRQRDIAATQRARGEDVSVLGGLALIGTGVATPFIETAALGVSVVTEPKETISAIISAGKEAGSRFLFGRGATFPEAGRVIREEPELAGGLIAGEILLAKGGGAVLEKGGAAAGKVKAAVGPVNIVDDVVRVPKDLGGKGIIDLETPSQAFIDIKIAGTVDDIATPISKQARIAGQEVTAVSAQRDLFGTITKREIKIEKPKPTPTSPELERAFFADPSGRLRVSRLGLEKQEKAGLVDILSGEVQVGATRPQALIFEDVKVAQFPKELAAIERKLKAGKTLTAAEEAKLLEFQLTPTGEFKPVGFLSKEPEITLAPGEVIRKGKVAGTVTIKGKSVEVILPEIVRPSQKLKNLIDKSKAGTLEAAESEALLKLLKKETGFSSREIIQRPVITSESLFGGSLASVSPLLSTGISQPAPSAISSPTSILSLQTQTAPSISPQVSIISVSPPVQPSPISPPVQPSPISSILRPTPRRPSTTMPTITPAEISRNGRRRKKKEEKEVEANAYYAEVLVKKKFKKVIDKPLTKESAEALAKIAADSTIHATSRITSTSKTPALDVIRAMGTAQKFRDYKIKGGRKIPLKNTWIEKRKFRLDKKKEVQTLQQFRKSAEFVGLFKESSSVGSSGGNNFMAGFGSSRKPTKKKKSARKKSTGFNWLS